MGHIDGEMSDLADKAEECYGRRGLNQVRGLAAIQHGGHRLLGITQQILPAPDRQKETLRMGQTLGQPSLVAPALAHAIEGHGDVKISLFHGR